jgi:hypothetical protein
MLETILWLLTSLKVSFYRQVRGGNLFDWRKLISSRVTTKLRNITMYLFFFSVTQNKKNIHDNIIREIYSQNINC